MKYQEEAPREQSPHKTHPRSSPAPFLAGPGRVAVGYAGYVVSPGIAFRPGALLLVSLGADYLEINPSSMSGKKTTV